MLLLIEQFNEWTNLRKRNFHILNFYYHIIHISIVLFISNISFQSFRQLVPPSSRATFEAVNILSKYNSFI